MKSELKPKGGLGLTFILKFDTSTGPVEASVMPGPQPGQARLEAVIPVEMLSALRDGFVDSFPYLLTPLRVKPSVKSPPESAVKSPVKPSAIPKPVPKGVVKQRKPEPGRVVQGRYIGHLRNFKGAAHERIRKLAETKGKAAAITEMKKIASRSK